MNGFMSRAVAGVWSVWLARDRGVSAVEYALLVAFIATAIIATVTLLGPKVANAFQPVDANLP